MLELEGTLERASFNRTILQICSQRARVVRRLIQGCGDEAGASQDLNPGCTTPFLKKRAARARQILPD